MKKKLNWMLMVTIVMAASMFTACGGDSDDDNGSGSGLTGWYMEYQFVSDELDKFDENGWLIPHWETNSYDDEYGNIHLGMSYTKEFPHYIHIIDDNGLWYYEYPTAWKQGTAPESAGDLLYQVRSATNGIVTVYGNATTYYTYTRSGNNITIRQGNEVVTFTITSDGLLQSGGGKWTKYNPNTVY